MVGHIMTGEHLGDVLKTLRYMLLYLWMLYLWLGCLYTVLVTVLAWWPGGLAAFPTYQM